MDGADNLGHGKRGAVAHPARPVRSQTLVIEGVPGGSEVMPGVALPFQFLGGDTCVRGADDHLGFPKTPHHRKQNGCRDRQDEAGHRRPWGPATSDDPNPTAWRGVSARKLRFDR